MGFLAEQYAAVGGVSPYNSEARKLVAADVANVIVTMLSMEDRGLFSDAVLSATRSL